MLYNNQLYWINNVNAADYLILGIAGMVRKKFKKDIIGCEMGTALGGGPEAIGKLWKNIGEIHAFDIFEYMGHPEFLDDDPKSHARRCMDRWFDNRYAGNERIPFITPEMWTYEYQRKVLDGQGLTNVVLHKGLINENSLKDIPYLNYALLDMDLVSSMTLGFDLVKDKIVKGGYLALHDVIPKDHIVGLYELYQNILNTGDYKIIIKSDVSYLVVLEKL
jgi:hypothetical protein